MRCASVVVGGVFLSLTVGCTLPSTFRAIHRELSGLPAGPTAPDPPGLSRYKGVIHVHTRLSHDSRGTEDEIVHAAKSAGLDFVMLTEHNSPTIFEQGTRSEQNGILFVRGAELRCEGRYILAVGLQRFINDQDMTCAALTAAVAEQGGVPLAAHPGRSTQWDDPSLAGVEIWDLYDEATTDRWRYFAWVLDILVWYGTYPDEILSRIIRRPDQALAAFDAQTTRRHLTAIGTPDAHQNIRALGRQLDPYPLAFRLVPVYLLAADGSREALLEALRHGRAYFAFEVFKAAPTFTFRAVDATGGSWTMGDEVPPSSGLTLEVLAPSRGRITLVRDGRILTRIEGDYASVPVHGPAVYRAEVEISVQGRWHPWIFSNPIYVR